MFMRLFLLSHISHDAIYLHHLKRIFLKTNNKIVFSFSIVKTPYISLSKTSFSNTLNIWLGLSTYVRFFIRMYLFSFPSFLKKLLKMLINTQFFFRFFLRLLNMICSVLSSTNPLILVITTLINLTNLANSFFDK